MRRSETIRLLFALAGIALWIGFPFIFWNGGIALAEYRCHRMARDPCFSDYIPVLEMMAFVLAAVLFYPFLKLAGAFFAPDLPDRSRLWIGAPSSSRQDRYPISLCLGGLGFVWLFLNAKSYPWALHGYWLYWGAWAVWFGAGLWFSCLPARDEA